jgi:hypothetical protein
MIRGMKVGVTSFLLLGLIVGYPEVGYIQVAKAQEDDSLCHVLQKYVDAAQENFSSAKGEMTDHDEYGSYYKAKYSVPSFNDCSINVVADIGAPYLSCRAADFDALEVFNSVRPCFAEWNTVRKATSSGEQNELSRGDGIRVRVRKSHDDVVLYIDAPGA